MVFRPRQGNYIKQKNGRFYYRRAIPATHRGMFSEKTEWVIALAGQNDTERKREAQAIAARHDRQMSFAHIHALSDMPADTVAIAFDLSPPDLPPHALAPIPVRFYRDGAVHDVLRYAITDDPTQRLAIEAKGYFVMSQDEARLQLDLRNHMDAYSQAETPEGLEIADLKAERAQRAIEGVAGISGHTVLSIMPLWHAHRKQAPATWRKHLQYAGDFAALHGDLPLTNITKRHVVEYVAHSEKLTYKGKPLSPASVSKRLDLIRALLAFAVGSDIIQTNPSTGVTPPTDTRPKTARSWQSLTLAEIETLVTVSTEVWTTRRKSRKFGRLEDLKTALQILIWAGARPEEVAQLRRADIDLAKGFMRIHNDESDTGDDARPRMMKNEHSIRDVPIHSKLLPIITAHMARSNGALLFPSFEPEPTPGELKAAKISGKPLVIKGRYARPLTKEWTESLREKVVGEYQPRKVLYSLRHSWSAESRRSGMPEHVRNALMGHANDNAHADRYGGDANWLDAKREHLEAMRCV